MLPNTQFQLRSEKWSKVKKGIIPEKGKEANVIGNEKEDVDCISGAYTHREKSFDGKKENNTEEIQLLGEDIVTVDVKNETRF